MKTYDTVSRINHWIIAVAYIFMLCFGFYLAYGGLPLPEKLPMINNHKAVGVILLFAGLWRVLYRIKQGFAAPAAPLPAWQEIASKASHWVLLACIILMPVSGLIMALYSGFPTSLFGLLTIPPIDKVEALSGAARIAHKVIAYTFAATLALHIAAAIKHHFIDKDRTLSRMIKG